MNLVAVRTTPERELPWTKNSIYRYSSENRYPEILIKVDGKLFVDMDAFHELVGRARDAQVKRAISINRGIGHSEVAG